MKKTKKTTQNLIHIYRFWNFLSLFCHYWCIQMWIHACTVVNDGVHAFHIFLSIVVNVVSIIWGVNYKNFVIRTWIWHEAKLMPTRKTSSHTQTYTHTITRTLNLWTINHIEEGRIIFDFFSVYLSKYSQTRPISRSLFCFCSVSLRLRIPWIEHSATLFGSLLKCMLFSLTMKHDSVYWVADWTQFSHPYIRIHIGFLSFYLVCLLCPVFGFESSN